MKKLLYIFFLFFLSTNLAVADDIEKIKLDGISIGDTLLQYMSKEKIIEEKKISATAYGSLGRQIFFEAYMFSKSGEYDQISVFAKSNDKNYKIYAVYASILYKDDIDKCYKKLDEETRLYDKIYNNLEKETKKTKINYDPSGKSFLTRTEYTFKNGDKINIECYDFHESFQKDYGYKNPDAFNVSLIKKELFKWIYR